MNTTTVNAAEHEAVMAELKRTDITQYWVQTLRNWSAAAELSARKARNHDDEFGSTLALARAEVYQLAAEELRDCPLAFLPGQCMKHAVSTAPLQRHTVPLMDFDSYGVRYVRARAWQYVALSISPDLPEVVPRMPDH
jgi:hypothetical protein